MGEGYPTSFRLAPDSTLALATREKTRRFFLHAAGTMTKQSYEMIEGQAGGGLGAGAAGEEGESGSLLPSGATPLYKGRVALVVGTLLGVALLAGCVSASPRAAARGAGVLQSVEEAYGIVLHT